jgi:hypothetical protein
MTFYGLPSTLIPKVSPETGLVATDPNWRSTQAASSSPRRLSLTTKPASTQDPVYLEKKLNFSSEVSLHCTMEGKRSTVGSSSRPSMESCISKTDVVVKTQYDLQALQADLMTAQQISCDGTAASIGANMTVTVQMILNVLEGQRAYERSLIKAEQALPSDIQSQAPDLLVTFSDESSEASGNESNISNNKMKDDSNVLEKLDESNVFEKLDESNVSSSRDKEVLASRQNRHCGSSALDCYWTESEDLLKSVPGIAPAPEVEDPAKTEDDDVKMVEDNTIGPHSSALDLELNSMK